ncbi:MAG: cytochrome b [Alphaproteobacteria bacterium]|nr:cytochrome b [Alphaproteobacteria bacterium]
MALKNTSDSFGWLAKLFHWLIAACIITLWIVGSLMGDMENSPTKFQIYFLHKSTGIMVLALAVLAFTWRAANKKPGLPPHVGKAQKAAASAVKYGLYLCMILMPMSGWVMSSAAGYPVSVYGLFTLPDLVAPDKALAESMKERHEATGNILLVLFCLHAGAALLHHFYHKDGVLRRMLP